MSESAEEGGTSVNRDVSVGKVGSFRSQSANALDALAQVRSA
jgi:hypothetical protein